ncbi:MAG: hypothetical protein K2P94_11880 [Rhodospirillaceae bacterium]|nr:hypothetical protein [Rhodospirillaceae bacterium]
MHEFLIKILALLALISYLSPMTKLQALKRRLRPGKVYRREDLAQWSNAVDRHLKQLVGEGVLTKLRNGLYLRPKKTAFGEAPAEERELVESFLKDGRFLLASPNAYNALGVGTTQLYNETVVYNHKRHGRFNLGGRWFDFRMKPNFPSKMTKEFLMVDLLNNLDRLAEDHDEVLERVKEKAAANNPRLLERVAHDYGKVRVKKFFSEVLDSEVEVHAA